MRAIVLSLLCLLFVQIETRAASPTVVAGRSLSEWSAEVSSPNGIARRRAVISLGAFGVRAVPELTQALSHEDAAVRYWAASELGDLADGTPSKLLQPAVEALQRMRQEPAIAVRIAAAYALCRIGLIDDGLPTLLDGLKHNERGVWNSAADFLARIGPPAKAAIPVIEQEGRRGADHIADICNEALRRIRGEADVLPSKTRSATPGDATGGSKALRDTKISATSVFSKAFFEAHPSLVRRVSESGSVPREAKPNSATRPNVLWISAEDISPSLGCYGDKYAITPRIDRFAAEGLRFNRCFTHAGVCAISRSGLITGMYPIAIGSQHMRSSIVPPPQVKCFPEYLRAAGYWTTNRSKTDYNFAPPDSAWDENSPNSRDWRGRTVGQPFFSVINLTTTHESQIRGKFSETLHDPAKAELPPYIPDCEVTRRDWARYADLITKLDQQVGAILDQLEADGLAENTIVFFWGDHGQGLSRGKRWLYDSGLRVPLLIRWPGQFVPGSTCDGLVCFLDFAPTMLRLARVDIPRHLHGQVLPPVNAAVARHENRQTGGTTAPATVASPREYLFGHRDRMDETYDLIRSARDQRFKYLRNFAPRRTYAQNIVYMNQMPTMREWRRQHAAGLLSGPTAIFFSETKPVEELYDTDADPQEVVNLADLPEHAETLRRLRTALERWQDEIGDTGLTPEPLLAEQMRPRFQGQTTAAPEMKLQPAANSQPATMRLSCATEGASIVFRTGDDSAWRLYVTPIPLAENQAIRAKACRLGFLDSREVSGP